MEKNIYKKFIMEIWKKKFFLSEHKNFVFMSCKEILNKFVILNLEWIRNVWVLFNSIVGRKPPKNPACRQPKILPHPGLEKTSFSRNYVKRQIYRKTLLETRREIHQASKLSVRVRVSFQKTEARSLHPSRFRCQRKSGENGGTKTEQIFPDDMTPRLISVKKELALTKG